LAEKTIKVGIIGCGGIAAQHIRGYQSCEDVVIAAAVDVDKQRAVDVAGADHAYTSIADMLANEKDLDAVSVCTPPKFHKEVVCAALEAGLAVLCEKPLAMNATEGQEMVDCAKKTGKLLVTAFCHRFHEPVMVAKDLINKGEIGKVVMFRNRFGGKMDMSKTWFSNREMSGGGSIPDTSVHSIDLFRFLVGDAAKAAAAINKANPAYNNIEDCNTILLQTADGAMGTIEASWTTPGSANVIEVYGTDGAAVIDYFKPGVRYIKNNSSEWEEAANTLPDRFILQAQHFVDCVRGKREPIVTGADGLKAMQIIDAAYKFATGDSWVKL